MRPMKARNRIGIHTHTVDVTVGLFSCFGSLGLLQKAIQVDLFMIAKKYRRVADKSLAL
jgi:hypothetical protein